MMNRQEILDIIDEFRFHKEQERKENEFLGWLDSIIRSDFNIFNSECDELQVKLLKQVKEKYLEIKNRVT